jgi:hypothetical protein
MNARNPTPFRDLLYDLSIGFSYRIVFALRDLIGFGTMRPLRRPVTRQSSGCELMITWRPYRPASSAARTGAVPLQCAVSGGPAPVRAYIEELLPDILEGRIEPAAFLIASSALRKCRGYRAINDREAIKVMVQP